MKNYLIKKINKKKNIKKKVVSLIICQSSSRERIKRKSKYLTNKMKCKPPPEKLKFNLINFYQYEF